jgi:UDP-glucuronate 4-epimerase
MSILVTGGAGFIGSHLIARLIDRSDESVVCLDNFNDYYDPALKRSAVESFARHPQVTVIEGDFRDFEAMARLFDQHAIEQVIHLGAYAGVRYSVAQPRVYQEANVGGTLSLLEAARAHPVRRFLSASSSTVYGRGAKAPFSEDAPLGVPASPYGATKRAAELMADTYHQLHGVPTVNLRFFSVYGPRLRPDLALTIFTKAIFDRQSFPLYGDGTIRRDFTHIDDICRGIVAALEAEDAVGQSINLGHNEPVEMRRVIDLLQQAIGEEAIIDHKPPRPEDLPVTCADLAKAKRLLDYQPRISLEEGLADYVAWYREYYGE